LGQNQHNVLKTTIPSENLSIEYNRNKDDALIALVTLGFSKIQAEKTLKRVFAEIDENAAVEDVIKQALKLLN
jgi:Holliday junction DNA helicase RuvA